MGCFILVAAGTATSFWFQEESSVVCVVASRYAGDSLILHSVDETTVVGAYSAHRTSFFPPTGIVATTDTHDNPGPFETAEGVVVVRGEIKARSVLTKHSLIKSDYHKEIR